MRLRKMGLLILATAVCCVGMSVTSLALTKISSVSVKFEADGYDDEGLPIVTTTVKDGQHYEVTDTYSAYYDQEEEYNYGTDVYVIQLNSEDGYYFAFTSADKIHLSGLGADFIKAKRQDNGTTLIIETSLPKAYESVGEIDIADWTADGHGTWSEAFGASSYSVSVMENDGKRSKQYETFGTSYDFRPFMQKPGNYTFRVRPVSATGKKGEWMESNSFNVSAESAAANAAAYHVDTVVTYADGVVAPGSATVSYEGVGWQKTDDGKYWYKRQDGSYPQETWLEEGGVWYYFGADGYMLSDAYRNVSGKEYYFDSDGHMLVSAKTPDGRTANADGVVK